MLDKDYEYGNVRTHTSTPGIARIPAGRREGKAECVFREGSIPRYDGKSPAEESMGNQK